MTETEAWAASLPPHTEIAQMDKIDTSTAAIDKLMDGVTPGPWSLFNYQRGRILSVCIGDRANGQRPCIIDSGGFDSTDLKAKENVANARFIAAARALVPALSAENADLRAKLDAAVDGLGRISAHYTDTGLAAKHMGAIARATIAKIKGSDHE